MDSLITNLNSPKHWFRTVFVIKRRISNNNNHLELESNRIEIGACLIVVLFVIVIDNILTFDLYPE